MAKKYYVVKKGKTPGIYLNWSDCKENVDGFSGAVYKGFETLQEAEAFLKRYEAYREACYEANNRIYSEYFSK